MDFRLLGPLDVAAWKEFVGWASEWPGSETFRFVRDRDQPNRFMSFAPWESFEAERAWKQAPDFGERIGKVLQHCEDFTPSTYELGGAGSVARLLRAVQH